MWGYYGGAGAWPWLSGLWMPAMMAVVWGVLIFEVALLARFLLREEKQRSADTLSALSRRYALGEVSREEDLKTRADLLDRSRSTVCGRYAPIRRGSMKASFFDRAALRPSEFQPADVA